jgi:hypothetical protein
MHSEWMKVMLEEIARKREETERGREEMRRRAADRKPARATRAAPAKPRR